MFTGKYYKTTWHLALLCGLFCTTLTSYADAPEDYDFTEYDVGIQRAKQSGKKVFLYFGRYGCGYCDKTNKESFSDATIKQYYSSNYELVYVDAEGGNRLTLPSGEVISEQQFGARLKTLVTPYFLFLEPDGTPILKVPGFKTKADLLKLHKFIHEGHYKTTAFNNFK